MHDGAKTLAKISKSNIIVFVTIAILSLETLQVTKVMVIDDTYQTI